MKTLIMTMAECVNFCALAQAFGINFGKANDQDNKVIITAREEDLTEMGIYS